MYSEQTDVLKKESVDVQFLPSVIRFEGEPTENDDGLIVGKGIVAISAAGKDADGNILPIKSDKATIILDLETVMQDTEAQQCFALLANLVDRAWNGEFSA